MLLHFPGSIHFQGGHGFIHVRLHAPELTSRFGQVLAADYDDDDYKTFTNYGVVNTHSQEQMASMAKGALFSLQHPVAKNAQLRFY
jgi:hypothetical protein